MKIELIFLWILSHLAHQTESVVRLSTNPSNGKVEVGSYWSMSCEIDGATNIVWYKWVGDLRIMIGHNDMVLGRQNDIISAGRFILDAKQNQEALLSELAMSSEWGVLLVVCNKATLSQKCSMYCIYCITLATAL